MSFKFEAYLASPSDPAVERAIVGIAESHGGWLDYREEIHTDSRQCIELTLDFSDERSAQIAEQEVKNAGHHTTGVGLYGPD